MKGFRLQLKQLAIIQRFIISFWNIAKINIPPKPKNYEEQNYILRTIYPILNVNNPKELQEFDHLQTYKGYEYVLNVTGDGGRSTRNICRNIKRLRRDPEKNANQESYRICMDPKYSLDSENCLVYSYG